MLYLKTKNGISTEVPETKEEDFTPKFQLNNEDEKAIKYYKSEGYVVIKEVFKKEECKLFINSWEKEVKGFKGYMYRQATAKAEKHILNSNNWVMNPILNLQSINPRKFPTLRSCFEKIITSNKSLANLIEKIIKDKPMIVQSMYFEGNSATWSIKLLLQN